MPLPEAFIQKYENLLGADAPAFFASFNQPVQKGYRLNPLKDLTSFLSQSSDPKLPYGQWGYYGRVDGHSIAHVTGVQYSQEPSAQFVGEVLAPKPGERVLDLAAAPGGKTTHLAAFMKGQGLLWANEIFMNRAKILSENVERLGLQNVVVSSQTPAELAQKLSGYFDKILLDAPCSGEGMFRKDPDAIQYWHENYPLECSLRQKEILASAVQMLRPGGTLVYSTCTFAPEEDEQMIAWLVATYPEFRIDPIIKPANSHISDGQVAWGDSLTQLQGTARLWPNLVQGEGHFVARLVKTDDDSKTFVPKVSKPVKLSTEEQGLLTDFCDQNLANFDLDFQRLVRFGDRLFLAPVDCPDLKSFKILRPGLALGSFKKQRFEPDHALALALSAQQVQQSYELDEAEWPQYVHGDVLTSRTNFAKGWVLILVQGNGLGWAKYVNGQLKNFYPKGLRFNV
ncbi:RsmF rRNA methyltransferase first C-terminal domain-containing protein [Convivina intestini]|uniref:NOL1/NOP2/sun family putative RNA methylase n=1 Tax=Convivina intestini TaxID=1505726 RepID=A0A2U1DFN5_9LACO|nr:RsmF rRNA methyltransferase first C-terminal domain-containing protein [Convivina intestini]PVY86487.1 NOL1/NOP2/sun family putative RNA methylase [Convivina intestini]CAH1850045.1 Ribosomal RNA small subunit methyltransferase F [Convivina intestini]SDB84120.1 NOL1/NOP2/sun family putative RNA methylase [Leuconostocaceae bacterium R-53105]